MAPVDAETASRADALKLEANKLFAQKQYHEAIAKYTAAIALSPVPAYYTNRAQCHLLTEGYGAAKADADTALALDPSFIKAFYRRAAANLAMGRLKEARADFREVTTRLPSDAAAKTKYVECDKLYRRIQFEKAIDSEIDRKRVAQMIELDNYPVPSDYEGPRMPVREGTTEEYVDLAFVKALVEWFREQKTLPVRYAYAILLQADRLLRSLPTLVDIAVPTDTVLTVCGDVHGQFYDVLNIFDLNGFPSPNLMYLFNGDFVDRGSFSVEVVLLFLALKLLYPESFFLNRGNHEATGMNQLYGFEGEVRHKYAVQGKRVFDLFQEVFEALPVAHLIGNKILVLHGGLYSNDTGKAGVVRLQELRELPRFHQPHYNSLLCESLWSDPQEREGRAPNPRGTAIQFGPDVTREFCRENGLTMVIRSHEQKDNGYEIAHDGQMVTVFSAPNYCDAAGNKGAYIRITHDLDCSYHTFDAVPHPNVKAMAYANVSRFM
ncbi:Palmitoyl-protein thioesterase 1 [Coemansia spiralis]|uniref:Serine/threonine-protein phosphatase n=2 Tax=Coemansia TaxID=4863 RepID=A0A9W8FZJ2_9FUNG|nr:Palmitoyl-protein thioesterase 1 [Coemansia umbellata]KAJ2622442.1 Palmitoyl-protein thioesterase 1 [Coemansia sp. RSA 1358]KAJ2672896.1 Palmitoyl-protein thioesterase 1 [Coemansia spiralis]